MLGWPHSIQPEAQHANGEERKIAGHVSASLSALVAAKSLPACASRPVVEGGNTFAVQQRNISYMIISSWPSSQLNDSRKELRFRQASATRISLSRSLRFTRSKRSTTFRVLGSAWPWTYLTVSSASSSPSKSWFQASAVKVAATWRSTMHMQPCKSCSVATSGPGSSSLSLLRQFQAGIELSDFSVNNMQNLQPVTAIKSGAGSDHGTLPRHQIYSNLL